MTPKSLPKKLKYGLIGLAGICVIAGLIPIPYLAAPKWEVWVVTEAGAPLSGECVRLSYKNYSAEAQSHEITMTTDARGHVLFPQQYGRASLFRRVFFTTLSASGGVHASFGQHAFVFVFGQGYEGDAVSGKYITDWTGSPATMTSTIVAKHSN